MGDKIKLFISKHNVWKIELTELRNLLNSTDLEESVKWGMPSYGCNGQNVIGIGAFKNHIGIWFHQGALLLDPHDVLINAQEGKTKSMRSIHITKKSPIDIAVLNEYITEAIKYAQNGKKRSTTKPRKVFKENIAIPPELEEALNSDKDLQRMFEKLTPIQQFDYSEYINTAKRAATKASRLEKIIPLIKVGKPISGLWKAK